MKFLASLICVIALVSMSQAKVRYDNYHVYRVHCSTEEQFNYLYQMELTTTKVDFWQISHAFHYADIMVAPELADRFLADIRAHGLKYEVLMENVQKVIDSERM